MNLPVTGRHKQTHTQFFIACPLNRVDIQYSAVKVCDIPRQLNFIGKIDAGDYAAVALAANDIALRLAAGAAQVSAIELANLCN